MSEPDELLDQVLRGIGRNVVNLQKMEGMLKFIVSSTGEIGSTIDAAEPIKNLEKSIKGRRKAINRLPMGRLVENFSKTLLFGKSEQEKPTNSENSYSIEVSLSIDDEELKNRLDQALGQIVKERNDLIHKRLIHFDPNSIESCRKLIKELDQQRARIKPQFEALSEICLSVKNYFKQLKEYMDSESFADELTRAQRQQE